MIKKIMCFCGSGLGTSFVMEMNAKKALKKLGYKECEVVIASDLTEEQKKKYRLYDNKTAEMASWDQKKLSAELCDVDFQGYDFGQPEIALPDDGSEEAGPKTMTCPCCGEVFEV